MEVQYSCNPNYVIVLYNAITKCLWSLRRIHSVFLINFVIFWFDELIMKYCIITFSIEFKAISCPNASDGAFYLEWIKYCKLLTIQLICFKIIDQRTIWLRKWKNAVEVYSIHFKSCVKLMSVTVWLMHFSNKLSLQ